MSLQRMIIVPPEVFDKWKHIIVEDEHLSELDKSMKSIINKRNMNDIDKWHHYRENLLKFSFNKGFNKNKNLTSSIPSTMTTTSSTKTDAKTSNKKSQTKFMRGNNLQTSDKETQVNFYESLSNNAKQMNEQNLTDYEDIYESADEMNNLIHPNKKHRHDLNDLTLKNSSNILNTDDKKLENDEVGINDDEMLRIKALNGQPKNVKIHKLLHKSERYMSYELSNGDIVTVFKDENVEKSFHDWNKQKDNETSEISTDKRSPYSLRSSDQSTPKSKKSIDFANEKKGKYKKKAVSAAGVVWESL